MSAVLDIITTKTEVTLIKSFRKQRCQIYTAKASTLVKSCARSYIHALLKPTVWRAIFKKWGRFVCKSQFAEVLTGLSSRTTLRVFPLLAEVSQQQKTVRECQKHPLSVCFETLEATTVSAQFLLEPTGLTKQFTD